MMVIVAAPLGGVKRMCLAIPMQILEIDRFDARCEARGIERRISLFLLQHEELSPGDMVMVHGGYAMQKMTAEEASSAWELYDQILAEEPAG
jgi:hydrogenase expression/formation protein HypC